MNGTCAAAAVARPSVSSIRSVAPSSTDQGHGRSFTGIEFLGMLGYAIGVQGRPNLEERQSGDIDAFEWRVRLGQLARHYGGIRVILDLTSFFSQNRRFA
jgi:hypothetical protein